MNLINKNYCELVPAYGRDYRTQKEVIKDFESGKDFYLQDYEIGDGYCSIRDFEVGTVVKLRYKKLTGLAVYKIKKV